ncbi:MAG: TlpA disulfide reductase family protein, partial [Bacteroidota bacterium]
MKSIGLYVFLTLLWLPNGRHTQETEIIKFDKLDALIKSGGDQVKVINFWATWCAPCIKELPYFESAAKKYGDQLEIHLVSLDFADQINRVNKFVERKKLKSSIYLLDETDYNSWIYQH